MRDQQSHSIKTWPLHERPREKLLEAGSERLTDAELLAVLFPTGAPNAIDQRSS